MKKPSNFNPRKYRTLLMSKKPTKLAIFLVFLVLTSATLFYTFKVCSPTYELNRITYQKELFCRNLSSYKIEYGLPQNTEDMPQIIYDDRLRLNIIGDGEIVDTSTIPHTKTGIKILQLDENSWTKNVARWKNLLIAANIDYEVADNNVADNTDSNLPGEIISKGVTSLSVYNLDTRQGQKFPIGQFADNSNWNFGSEKLEEVFSEFRKEWYGSNFVNVNGDNLFFGNRIMEYRVDLPLNSNSKITKLLYATEIPLVKSGNFNLFWACIRSFTCGYFSLDFKTLTLSGVTKTYSEPSYDPDNPPYSLESLVGFDNLGRTITKVNQPNENNKTSEYITKQLLASPIDDDSQTTELLSATDLPEGMVVLYMINDTNKILMVGESRAYYIYNLQTKTIKKIKNSPTNLENSDLPDWPAIVQVSDDQFCDLDEKTVINMSTDSYFHSDSEFDICSQAYQDNSDKIETILNNLKLPRYMEFVDSASQSNQEPN